MKPKKKKQTNKVYSGPKKKLSKMEQLLLLADECNKALKTAGKVFVGKYMPKFERIRSGILSLDYVCAGGIPRGRMTMFSGEDSSAKTLAALLTVVAVQAMGGTTVWVAGEGFDVEWAKRVGVDVEKLILVVTETGDTSMEAALTMIESGLVDLLVIDSIQSLGTTRESEGGVEQEAYAGAGAPQMWARVMRRVYAAMNGVAAHTAIITISQVRSAIGKYSPNGTPEPESSNIKALKHWKAVEVYFKRGEPLYIGKDEKKKLIAYEFKLKNKKNKTGMPYRVSSFWFYFDEHDGIPFGVDKADEVFRLGKAYDLIKTKGSWIEGYDIKAQGEDAYVEKLRALPKTVRALQTDILDVSDAA